MSADQIEAIKIFSAYAILTVVVFACAWAMWLNLVEGDSSDAEASELGTDGTSVTG